jgi:hypothetical protein
MTQALVIILSLLTWQGGMIRNPRAEFVPRTLNQILEQSSHQSATLEDGTILFTTDKLPSRVKVTYQGQSRAIRHETKEFIDGWVKMIARHPKIPKLFDTEFLFTEGSAEYWLPVPNNGPNYAKELRKGQEVILFVSRIGGRKNSGKMEWFFVVNNIER